MNRLVSTNFSLENVPAKAVLAALVLFFLLSKPAFSQAQMAKYPKILPNVPYSEVAKLTPTPHSSQISYGDFPDQKILFWPSVIDKQNNTIIFIHGGCWLAQYDIKHSFALSAALADNGFDVYSIEYRRTGNGGEWPVALNDIQVALSVIHQDLAGTDHAYKAPISILGHSAGGHLATLAAADLAPDRFTNVHLFGLAPIIDLMAYAEGDNNCQTATPGFMGGTPAQRGHEYKAASPLEYKNLISGASSLKSAIMMVGNKDAIVPLSMAQHPGVEFMVIGKAGHFDWIHPGSDAFTLLLDKLTAVSTPH